MRRTIEIPDDLFYRITDRLAEDGSTLNDFLTRAAQRELTRLRFPLIPSRHPGTLHSLTNSEIDELSD